MSYSRTFFLTPDTLSGFYVQAMQDAGHTPKGWRAARGNAVEVLTTENQVVRIDIAPGNQLRVELIEEVATST